MSDQTTLKATSTKPCRCGDADCDLESLAYDDLLYLAHKWQQTLRMANGTCKRRGSFIRRIGRWDDFTAWVREGQPE